MTKTNCLKNLKIRISDLFRISIFEFWIYQRGFTLIELLIYTALVSIFLTSAIFFAWDVVYGREKSFIQQTVQQEARRAILRLGFEVRMATTINSITPTQLSLEMAEGDINPTIFSLSDGTLQMTRGTSGPYDLTGNQVYVSSLEFADLSSSDNNSKNIQVILFLRQAQTGVSAQFEAQTTLIDSFELNSAFNQARKLLVDTTSAELTQGNKKIEGITVQNSTTDDIAIDKMTVSWTDEDEDDEKIETISINDSDVWIGSENSGTLLDVNNFTVTGDGTVFDIDYLEFDKSMTELTVTIVFTMSDGSTIQSEMSFGVGVAPSPSPSPTPTPSASPLPTPSPTTCAEYCQGLDYSSGTCRQNKTQCEKHDETHESGGDQYCTGGESEDTCCCSP